MSIKADANVPRWIATLPPVSWALRQAREMLIGTLRQGPIPQHVAFEMDGNRRFAKNNHIETIEGHNMGFEALAKVCADELQLESLVPTANYLPHTGTRSMLQVRSQSRYRLRLQYRELQPTEIGSQRVDEDGQAQARTAVPARRATRSIRRRYPRAGRA